MLEEAEPISVVVDAAGAIAWLQEDSFGRHDGATPPPTVYDAFAVDSQGFHSLRTDMPVRPTALELLPGAVSWKVSGHPQSVRLG